MWRKVVKFLLAYLASYYLYIIGNTNITEVFAIFFVIISILFLKTPVQEVNLLYIIFASFCSMSFLGGNLLWNNLELEFLKLVGAFIGGIALFYYIIKILEEIILNIQIKRIMININIKHLFIGTFLIIFLLWLPMLIMEYPGILISDSTWQWYQALGKTDLSNHHPIVHTFLIRISQKFCKLIYSKLVPEKAVLIYSLMQMVLMSLMISGVLCVIWNMLNNWKIYICMVMYYVFYPMHSIFSIYMTKDVLFSAFVMVYSVILYKIGKTDGKWLVKVGNMILYLITSILLILFRSNGIIVSIGVIVLLVVLFPAIRKKNIIILVSMFALYFIYGTILTYTHVSSPNIVESLGMPINQISAVVSADERLTNSEREQIEKIIPINELKKVYNPYYSDPVKTDELFDSNYLEKHKLDYFKLWLKLLIKYPGDYIESQLRLTIGYWYPGIHKGMVSFDVQQKKEFLYEIGVHESRENRYANIYIGSASRDFIGVSFLFSIGLAVVIYIFLFIMIIKKYDIYRSICCIPTLLVWFSLLLLTPSYCETRYIYCIFLMLPFLLAVLWDSPNEQLDKKMIK